MALMPSSQELRDRAYQAGASPEVQALGGALGDVVNIPDPATVGPALAALVKAGATAKGLAAAAPLGLKAMAVAPGKGRGLAELLADATPAEQAALKARLEAEAGQVGGAESNVSREQALQGLTSSAPPSLKDLHSKLYKDSQGVTYGPDGKPFWTKNAYENELSRSRVTIAQNADKIAPLEASLKKALISKDAQSAAKIREKINAIRAESAAAQKRMDFLQAWRRGEAEPLPPQGPWANPKEQALQGLTGGPVDLEKLRADGFNVDRPIYHGTDANFDTFDPALVGKVKKSDWGEGSYFTPSESTADYYRTEAVKNSDERYNKAFQRYENLAKTTTTWKNGTPTYTKETEDALLEFQKIAREIENDQTRGRVVAGYARMRNPMIEHSAGGSWTDPNLAKRARAKGHDSLIIRNPHTGEDEEIILFNPKDDFYTIKK